MNKKNICRTGFYEASTYTRERERERNRKLTENRNFESQKQVIIRGKKNSQTRQTDH